MKKYLMFCLLCLLISLNTLQLKADSDYLAYESITLHEGQFLSDYSEKDYKAYLKEVTKRRFAGWNVKYVYEDCRVTYKSKSVFSYYNDGTTPIEYNYKYESSYTTARNITSTGSIGINMSGPVKKFKGNLDASLKITSSTETVKKETETWTIKMQVDPQTMANLYVVGEGKITNGVAARYLFWLELEKGGFEVFVVTTQYYRLEKVKI
ncbi:hypothetical protein N7548_05345 [Acholeplasma manati]|uniref:Uncharacterized protein n=1 Tax=Paracholeplasma manati TaxID=591373 RepID=A0ABT2Y683_9MOLU|nr:hypothetical protein [Paracholeplasma manati]MCV2232249.1 hypothetical protein [Paracholeplasma manati]